MVKFELEEGGMDETPLDAWWPGRKGDGSGGIGPDRDLEQGGRIGSVPRDTTDGWTKDDQPGFPFQVVERDTYDRLAWAFNALVAVVALVLLAPVMLLIAVAIKFDSSGPVFYRQLRIGIDRRDRSSSEADGRRTLDIGGRPFTIYKFRTMHVGAEAESGPTWSPASDDRVTRVGRFLRKHRLDELPQLWNVVKGDMSIVGPRPERPSLVSDLREEIPHYPLRQKVLPGITGWAQVNQGSDQTLDDVKRKLKFDLEYLQERSILFDLRIMVRTVPVMLERDTDMGEDVGECVEGRDGRGSGRVTRPVAT